MTKQPHHRCAWAQGSPLEEAYHDNEWGRPQHDDAKLFEMLLLESFQAGLSWFIILKKREAFRSAFSGFDVSTVAAYGDEDIERLLADEGIVRNRLKIKAAIRNAQLFIQIQKEFGSFNAYLMQYIPDGPVVNDTDVFPTSSPLSDLISKDLHKRGMRFVGTVIIYSYLQAVGIINDHEQSCFAMQELLDEAYRRG